MINSSKWNLAEAEKKELISALSQELILLRMKAEISQSELANLIGVSRQTYGAIERGVRLMTWNTYLSLILFFDYNLKTHQMIRTLNVFPHDIVSRFNNGIGMESSVIGKSLGSEVIAMIAKLDEKGIHSIKALTMVEYARCSGISAESVVKAFNESD